MNNRVHTKSTPSLIVRGEAMWLMLQHPSPEDFVVATGATYTLEEFVTAAFQHFGLDWKKHVNIDQGLLRPYEIERTVGDAGKAERLLGWRARRRMPEIVVRLIEAEIERRKSEGPRGS